MVKAHGIEPPDKEVAMEVGNQPGNGREYIENPHKPEEEMMMDEGDVLTENPR